LLGELPRGFTLRQWLPRAKSSSNAPPGFAESASPFLNKRTIALDPIFDTDLKTIEGGDARLSDYAGSALLIVNVASQCGFTPQYAGLEDLH
jgi:Glutathione peroxidase